jgi:hypothetical protein
MAGVNRAAVAVTDTFDVWRVRTNELNTSLNAGTSANTADTIVWRGDSGEIDVATLSANTVTLARASDAPTITIASALDGSATTGSFTTTGGIKVDRVSYFGQGVTVAGNIVTNGSTTLGNDGATDTITLTGRVNSTLENATSISYDIGSSTRLWKTFYGQGINLTANTTIAADSTLKITSGHVTKPSLKITDAVAAGSTSTLVNINSNSPDTAARDLAYIRNQNVNAVGATALHLQSDGGRGLKVTSSLATGLPSIEIVSSHSTADASLITASSLTSGKALHVTSAGAARTGHMVHLASTDTGAGSTGDVLHVKSSSTTNTAMIANFANATTNVFSVMVGGKVKIDGDLDVTGSTTQFRTTSALVNDKTLVLGSVGEAVTGVTFTQHATTPVFTTTAALRPAAGNVLFIATSSSSVITSETLYTVASTPSGTTFTVTGNHNTSGDASTRTVVFTGPQLDSGVDDAGIYIPGSTAIHYVKWDDDDNFWEFNDSVKIDTTTQLVVPVGTAAQQPAATATATVAARTQGALRFNTTSNIFEGVHVTGASAPFEAFATQNFSTAIAVALG